MHQKPLAKLFKIQERKIRESLEINNLKTKAEYDKSIKVLHRHRGNIVITNSRYLLKEFIANSYDKEIYLDTRKLQQEKIPNEKS